MFLSLKLCFVQNKNVEAKIYSLAFCCVLSLCSAEIDAIDYRLVGVSSTYCPVARTPLWSCGSCPCPDAWSPTPGQEPQASRSTVPRESSTTRKTTVSDAACLPSPTWHYIFDNLPSVVADRITTAGSPSVVLPLARAFPTFDSASVSLESRVRTRSRSTPEGNGRRWSTVEG